MHSLSKWLCLWLLFLAGCQSSYREKPLYPSQLRPQLEANARLYIAFPGAVRNPRNDLMDPGSKTLAALRTAFSKYIKGIYTARQIESLDGSLASAKKYGCRYLVYPTILAWDDRPTEWTGRRDKLELKLEVFEVETGQTLHAAILEGRSRWMTDGGDTPVDLLEEPIAQYAASLFRLTATPSALPR